MAVKENDEWYKHESLSQKRIWNNRKSETKIDSEMEQKDGRGECHLRLLC